MSDFINNGWALYVAGIVIFGLVYCAFVLIGAAKHKVVYDAQGNVDKTTGHVWDEDLRELNNPLPRWWLFLFIITLAFACGYLALYPGLAVTKGSLGWTSVGQWEKEVEKAKADESKVFAKFNGMAIEDIARDSQGRAMGERIFLNNCAACHGSDAKGAKGFPNLTDKTWLHGFGEEAIINMVNKGKVNVMPAQETRLSADQIKLVASYVYSLSHPTQTAQAK